MSLKSTAAEMWVLAEDLETERPRSKEEMIIHLRAMAEEIKEYADEVG